MMRERGENRAAGPAASSTSRLGERSRYSACSPLAALVVVLVVAATTQSSHALTFSDSEFLDSDWTVFTEEFPQGVGDTSVGTASGLQVTTGGNPGANRQSDLVFDPDVPPFQADLLIGNHLQGGATYDPSTQGAIPGLDFAWDVFIPSGSVAGGGIVLRQGGIFYYSRTQQFSAGQSLWTSVSASMEGPDRFLACEDLFGAICAGGGVGSPDFSSSGGPIEFGFFQAVSTNSSTGGSFRSFVDNWSVTVVPEPGAASLVLMGLLMLRGHRAKAIATKASVGGLPVARGRS